jgi:predicted dehydrogenase
MASRIGILGVGGFGLFCLEQYRTLPDVRITAIAGTHPEKYARLAREYAIPFFTTRWEELVTHPEVDVVYIATPPHLHAPQALAALAAGKHVFCDKPLATTLADADAMLAAADAYGVRLGINFVMRYAEIYTLVRDVVACGALGEPLVVSFHNAAGDLPAGHWFWDPARSGGIPVEHGVHFFDIFAAMFGAGTVRGATAGRRKDGTVDQWSIGMRYGEVLGHVYHGFTKPSALEHTWGVVECARGYLAFTEWLPTRLDLDGLVDLDGMTALARRVRDLHLEPAEGEVTAHGRAVPVTHRVQGTVIAGDKQALYAGAVRDAMADFLAWTRDPGHTPRVTAVDARAALAIALQATALAGV